MSKTPPIPPENRDPGMTGNTPSQPKGQTPKAPTNSNLKEVGRQGNINQNTHNQGYQQGR
jgi:hypothetical protein